MAVERFFLEIAQKYLVDASKQDNEAAAQLFHEAAQFSISGDIEGAKGKSSEARELLNKGSQQVENAQQIREDLIPDILSRLRGLGIPVDLPIDFLSEVAERIRIGKEAIIFQSEPEKETSDQEVQLVIPSTEFEGKKLGLTEKQHLAARARLRLVDEVAEEVSLVQAVAQVYRDQLAGEEDTVEAVNKYILRIGGSWGYIVKKLEKIIASLPIQEETSTITFPLSEVQISSILSVEVQDLLRRLSGVEAYHNMTLEQVVAYTKNRSPVRLKLKQEHTEITTQVIEEEKKEELQIERKGRKSKLEFTDNQFTAAIALFRLVGEEGKITQYDAVKKLFPGELIKIVEELPQHLSLNEAEERAVEIMRGRIRGQRQGIIAKLRVASDLLIENGYESIFPLNEEQIALFESSPNMQNLLRQMGNLDRFRGGSITDKPEKRRTQKELSLPEPFTEHEIYYLATQMLERGEILNDPDKDFLDGTIDELWQKGLEIEDPEGIAQNLLRKMRAYNTLDKAKKGKFFDRQTDTGQLLLGLVGNWGTEEELQKMLNPKP